MTARDTPSRRSILDLLTRVHSAGQPIGMGNLDARLPADLWRELTDLHAAMLYESANAFPSETREPTAEEQDLRAMGNMILLCGEEECRDVRGYAAKLRALIDGLIVAKRDLESGFMQGAYARLKNLQEAERTLSARGTKQWIPISERLYEGEDRTVMLMELPRDAVIWVGPHRPDWIKANHITHWIELP